MIEIYNRIKGEDPDFEEGLLNLTNELHCYLQQIKTIFNVEAGAVLGAVDMSMGIEELVYETNISQAELQNKVLSQIVKYCSLYPKFRTNIMVKFFKGTEREICFIDVVIDDIKQLEFRVS